MHVSFISSFRLFYFWVKHIHVSTWPLIIENTRQNGYAILMKNPNLRFFALIFYLIFSAKWNSYDFFVGDIPLAEHIHAARMFR